MFSPFPLLDSCENVARPVSHQRTASRPTTGPREPPGEDHRHPFVTRWGQQREPVAFGTHSPSPVHAKGASTGLSDLATDALEARPRLTVHKTGSNVNTRTRLWHREDDESTPMRPAQRKGELNTAVRTRRNDRQRRKKKKQKTQPRASGSEESRG